MAQARPNCFEVAGGVIERSPEGNGCAERFILTMKEQLLWLRPFRNVEDLRLALHVSADKYVVLSRNQATR